MVNFGTHQSTRRLFALFFIIAFLVVSLLYFLGIRPQASEIGVALESRTGTLRDAGVAAPKYFYLHTDAGDVLTTGVSEDIITQLKSYVGDGEITVQGQLQPPSRRPSLFVPQPIFVVSTISPPSVSSVPCSIVDGKVDVMYLVDASGTMDDKPDGLAGAVFDDRNRPDHLISSIANASKAKLRQDSDRLGIATFSSPSKIANPFSDNLAAITTAMGVIKYSADGSVIGQGLQTVSQYAQSSRRDASTPVIVVILTDSQSNADAAAIQLARQDHQDRNVSYYGIALGGDNTNLRNVVESGGGKYFTVSDHDKVDGVVGQLFDSVDSDYANCVSLELESSKPRIRTKGGQIDLVYQYKNNSRHEIKEATITHTLPVGLDTLQDQGTVSIFVGTLQPGESGTKQVTVKASQ
jgi:hypothetical protein